LGARFCGIVARVWSPSANPFRQPLGFLRIELLFRGHTKVGVVSAYGDDDAAFVGFSGDKGGSRVAATCNSRAGIEEQTALPFAGFHRVAFQTVFGEDWADVLFEEFEVSR
jgi:hypothetical protein